MQQQEQLPFTVGLKKKNASKCCTRKQLRRLFPILQWLPLYNTDRLAGDFVAGITVGLTSIPQGLAYAAVAGLPPNYGLYSSFMSGFVYMIFGSCKDVSVGPVAILALVLSQYTGTYGNAIAILIAFINGIILIVCGILNLGFVLSFISKPVVVAFSSASCIAICTTQLGGLFGYSLKSEGFLSNWIELFQRIGETRYQDLVLGVSCMVVLFYLMRMRRYKMFTTKADDTGRQKIYKKLIFLCSVGRNILVIIIASLIAYGINEVCIAKEMWCTEGKPFLLIGHIQAGLPPISPPPFTATTDAGTFSFSEMISASSTALIAVPLITTLESFAIASSFSDGTPIDSTQEMLALGLCNLLSSFVSSMPVTGSFSRSSLNAHSGGKTTTGGIYASLLVIMALGFLTPLFEFIPKACLSAVIICSLLVVIEYEEILPIWRVYRLDQLPLWVTFFTCLFWRVEYGILVGALVSLLFLIYHVARPDVLIQEVVGENGQLAYIYLEPKSGLDFSSTDFVRSKVSESGTESGRSSVAVVLNIGKFIGMDYTAACGLQSLSREFGNRGQKLYFVGASPSIQSSLLALDKSFLFINSHEQIMETVLRDNDGNQLDDTLFRKSAKNLALTNSNMSAMIKSSTIEIYTNNNDTNMNAA